MRISSKIICAFFCFAIGLPGFCFAKGEVQIQMDIRAIYAKYDRYMRANWDGDSFHYAVPSRFYKQPNGDTKNDWRMQTTFATLLHYNHSTLADGIRALAVRHATVDVRIRLASVNPIFYSFNDAIGIFLTLRLLDEQPNIISVEEREEILQKIHVVLPTVLQAPDTENRALLGAAYGLAAAQDPLLGLNRDEYAQIENIVRAKIEVGLKSIDKDFGYREGPNNSFSLHYHLVSAAMLHVLGAQLQDADLQHIAREMTQNTRRNFPAGKLASIGRPGGIGLQTVLLRAFSEKMSGNKNWYAYWQKDRVGRGFIDPKNPNRLVWLDQGDKTLNDDYSFVSMVELFGPYLAGHL